MFRLVSMGVRSKLRFGSMNTHLQFARSVCSSSPSASACRSYWHKLTAGTVFALAIVLLTAQWSHAGLTVTISQASDFDPTGLGSGDYAPIAGTTAASANGQINNLTLIDWGTGGSDDRTFTTTVGTFLSAVNNFIPDPNPVNSVLLAFGVNQSTPKTSPVHMTQLDITYGENTNSFDTDDVLEVYAYGAGAGKGEGLIQVNFSVDLRSLNAGDTFSIMSTVEDRNDGAEVLWLANAATAVPEPGAFLFGGAVCAVIGMGVGGRRLKNKLFARG
jgi:hypothetical protein